MDTAIVSFMRTRHFFTENGIKRPLKSKHHSARHMAVTHIKEIQIQVVKKSDMADFDCDNVHPNTFQVFPFEEASHFHFQTFPMDSWSSRGFGKRSTCTVKFMTEHILPPIQHLSPRIKNSSLLKTPGKIPSTASMVQTLTVSYRCCPLAMSAGALTPSFCEHPYTITTLTNLFFNEFPFDLVPFLKMQFGKSGHICYVHFLALKKKAQCRWTEIFSYYYMQSDVSYSCLICMFEW